MSLNKNTDSKNVHIAFWGLAKQVQIVGRQIVDDSDSSESEKYITVKKKKLLFLKGIFIIISHFNTTCKFRKMTPPLRISKYQITLIYLGMRRGGGLKKKVVFFNCMWKVFLKKSTMSGMQTAFWETLISTQF